MWILLLFVGVGTGSSYEANALTSAEFSSEKACIVAGKAAQDTFGAGTKRVRYVCAEK